MEHKTGCCWRLEQEMAMTPEQTADKIVEDWLVEVGSDRHGIEWDDISDLKARIAKALEVPKIVDLTNVDSICLSYRHDFGLMVPLSKREIAMEAKGWIHAIGKAITDQGFKIKE